VHWRTVARFTCLEFAGSVRGVCRQAQLAELDRVPARAEHLALGTCVHWTLQPIDHCRSEQEECTCLRYSQAGALVYTGWAIPVARRSDWTRTGIDGVGVIGLSCTSGTATVQWARRGVTGVALQVARCATLDPRGGLCVARAAAAAGRNAPELGESRKRDCQFDQALVARYRP